MEAKTVTTVDQNELYTARLEFRSIGDGPHVQPHITFSHNFPNDYEGEYPAAFLAMRDIAIFLSLSKNTQYTDQEIPTDPDELARLSISTAQASAAVKN